MFAHGLASLITIVDEKTPLPASLPTYPEDIDPTQIRVGRLSEYKELALTLALAFAKDDVAMYIIDTPDREHWTAQQKWDLHLTVMEYLVYAHLLDGLVTYVGENYGSVALWMPPNKNMDSIWTTMRSGLWRLNYQLSPEARKRFFTEFMPLLHDVKHRVLGERDDDSWYLVYLGTRPESRGKGYARRLIEQISYEADREGRACYLESSNIVNVQIYQKMGYKVVEPLFLTRGEKDVRLDIMVREPKA